jgi:hypothetical protein
LGELLTSGDPRCHANGARLRALAHDQIHYFELGSVLGLDPVWWTLLSERPLETDGALTNALCNARVV